MFLSIKMLAKIGKINTIQIHERGFTKIIFKIWLIITVVLDICHSWLVYYIRI